MKMKFILLVLVMISFAAVFTAGAQTVPSENWSNGQVKKWYKKKEWLGGLNSDSAQNGQSKGVCQAVPVKYQILGPKHLPF
jgi:hypothetical protein